MKKVLIVCGLGISCLSTAVTAAEQPRFYEGKVPVTKYVVNQVINKSEYTIGFNYARKEPLYTSEYLTPNEIQEAEPLTRHSSYFAEDEALPEEYRVPTSIYTKSGYQRGHNTPSADMPNYQAQHETFLTDNIVPQPRWNNTGVWKEIEFKTREIANAHPESYVITGNIFTPTDKFITKGNESLEIPHYMYKAVLLPKTKNYCVYLSDQVNKDAPAKLYNGADFYAKYDRDPIPAATLKGFTCNSETFTIPELKVIK